MEIRIYMCLYLALIISEGAGDIVDILAIGGIGDTAVSGDI